MQCMSSDRFIKEYELKLKKEFEFNGEKAQWAPGTSGPRFWGEEDAQIALDIVDWPKNKLAHMPAACTSDNKFLAVAEKTIITIYDLKTRQVQAKTVGHDHHIATLHFAPLRQRPGGDSLSVADETNEARDVKYLLFAVSERSRETDTTIVTWELDVEGRPLTKTETPFEVETLANKAMSAISIDLMQRNGVAEDELIPIRRSIVAALQTADAKNRMKHFRQLNGYFPGFGTTPASHDGTRLLYQSHGETTQHGMRPPDELPQIVVVNLADGSEICRMKGHTDGIMWSGWSADDNAIVTASWDETYKIWDANTGECRHTIGPTGGQNWAGQCSPVGQYVVLSGGYPTKVSYHDLQDGEKLAELGEGRLKQNDWHRELHWSPAGDFLAIASGLCVLLWNPFSDTLETILELEKDEDNDIMNHFATFHKVTWVDGGNKLIVQGSERTIFIWDMKQHCKWRFQHPKGVATEFWEQFVYYMAEENTVISVDGDRTIRFWKL